MLIIVICITIYLNEHNMLQVYYFQAIVVSVIVIGEVATSRTLKGGKKI
jgi:hypothetical protein